MPEARSSERLAFVADGVRTDPQAGTSEEVRFFGPRAGQIVGTTYLPREQPVGGAVICCPLLAEFLKNYRKEVVLARALCASGIAVQRFHYRGTGNSDGESSDVTFESMRDDALAAAGLLAQRTGVKRIAFIGARLGALVAAAAAGESGDGPLVLWEPVLDARRYFKEVFRARLIRDLKEQTVSRPSGDGLAAELERSGIVDVLGYPIEKPLYDSLLGRTLDAEIAETPRPVLLVQMSRARTLRGEYGSLLERWRERGLAAEPELFGEEVAWWFPPNVWRAEETHEGPLELAALTTAWIARQFEPETAA